MALERIVYQVGDTVRAQDGRVFEVVKVHPFGTVDARDAAGRVVLITGLPVFRGVGA